MPPSRSERCSPRHAITFRPADRANDTFSPINCSRGSGTEAGGRLEKVKVKDGGKKRCQRKEEGAEKRRSRREGNGENRGTVK